MKRVALLAFIFLLAGCGRGEIRQGASDITGVMPDLSFHLTRANDNRPVSAADYRGKAVLLYFGYTHCPDECPTTLANLANALRDLGPRAEDVRVLFVSVDPGRDDVSTLKTYVRSFAPQIDGLRGTDDQLAQLARRYRVLYRVAPTREQGNTDVMHSDSTFFFDTTGRARLVTTNTNDPRETAGDIRKLDQ